VARATLLSILFDMESEQRPPRAQRGQKVPKPPPTRLADYLGRQVLARQVVQAVSSIRLPSNRRLVGGGPHPGGADAALAFHDLGEGLAGIALRAPPFVVVVLAAPQW